MSARPLNLKPGVVAEVDLDALHADPDQPRHSFDDASLERLTANIRERGIQQPILVRRVDERLVIMDGERRWRAARAAGLRAVPVLYVDTGAYEDTQLRLDQVSVNQLREQLKPMDLARVLSGFRAAGKTTNDIAATLARQGHPAMKPAQIEHMVELTRLPDWTQAMVDAEEIAAGDAAGLLDVLRRKGVEKPLKKMLTQSISYSGRLTGDDVHHAVNGALSEAGGVSLLSVEPYHRKPIVHFAWKSRCKGCEHLQRSASRAFCMSPKLFQEHNQEAKDAGLGPGGKKPEKPKAAGAAAHATEDAAKTQIRERSLSEKARDYLHAYLVGALRDHIERLGDPQAEESPVPDIVYHLVLWAALGRPGDGGARGAVGVRYDPEVVGNTAARALMVKSLDDVVTGGGEVTGHRFCESADEILAKLAWRETRMLAHRFWGWDIFDVWNPEAPFFDLFRKAELVHLANVCECELPEGRKSWDALKASELKAALLAQPQKLRRPQILDDLYSGPIERPAVGFEWEYGAGDEDESEPIDDLEEDA